VLLLGVFEEKFICNNVAGYNYLCKTMFVKKRYQKLVASLFVLLMFAISFVQLSHWHVTKPAGSGVLIKINTENDAAIFHQIKDAVCFICDYHFIKDADHTIATPHTISPVFFTLVTISLITQKLSAPHFGLENRGPPSFI
jgi:hypothetical protein